MDIAKKIVLGTIPLIGLVFLGAWGISKWMPETDVPSVSVEKTALPIVEVTDSHHADVTGTGGCDVRVLYPQIGETSTISSDVKAAINTAIVNQVRDFYASEDIALADAETGFLNRCASDLTDLVGAMTDPVASAQEAWVSEIGYDMKLNDGTYLSLGIANYISMGGAHPNTTELFTTFDVATGKTIALTDLVTQDRAVAFEVQEKQWLIDNASDRLFEESLKEFQDFVAAPSEEKALEYLADGEWYLTPENIVTFYNPYTIAPYAAGPLEVMMPR